MQHNLVEDAFHTIASRLKKEAGSSRSRLDIEVGPAMELIPKYSASELRFENR